MFLDTAGAGGPPARDERRQDDEPEKPIKVANKDLALALGYVVLTIFFGTIAFFANWHGHGWMRDSLMFWTVMAASAAICVYGWILLHRTATRAPRSNT